MWSCHRQLNNSVFCSLHWSFPGNLAVLRKVACFLCAKRKMNWWDPTCTGGNERVWMRVGTWHLSEVLGLRQTVQRFKGYILLNIYLLKKTNIWELQNSTKNVRKQRNLLLSYCRSARSGISLYVADTSGQTGVSKSFVHSAQVRQTCSGFGGTYGLASD